MATNSGKAGVLCVLFLLLLFLSLLLLLLLLLILLLLLLLLLRLSLFTLTHTTGSGRGKTKQKFLLSPSSLSLFLSLFHPATSRFFPPLSLSPFPWYPTTNGGVQNGSSVGTCTHYVHVFARAALIYMPVRCLLTKFLRQRSVGCLLRVPCQLGTVYSTHVHTEEGPLPSGVSPKSVHKSGFHCNHCGTVHNFIVCMVKKHFVELEFATKFLSLPKWSHDLSSLVRIKKITTLTSTTSSTTSTTSGLKDVFKKAPECKKCIA